MLTAMPVALLIWYDDPAVNELVGAGAVILSDAPKKEGREKNDGFLELCSRLKVVWLVLAAGSPISLSQIANFMGYCLNQRGERNYGYNAANAVETCGYPLPIVTRNCVLCRLHTHTCCVCTDIPLHSHSSPYSHTLCS